MEATFSPARRRRLRIVWLIAVLVVIVGSLLPGASFPMRALGSLGIGDKLLHATAYAILAFLPALPHAWPEGHIHGLKARGGIEVDLDWRDGKPVSAILRTGVSGPTRLRPPQGSAIASIQSGKTKLSPRSDAQGDSIIDLQAGHEYQLLFR